MANIDQYLEEIEVASRGEEVRDSIINAFEALNSEGPGTMDWGNITDTPDTLTGYGVSEVPASMVSGVLALNNIPPSALERVVPVADDTARFALTLSDVQNGDTVKVLSTQKLYLVVDDTSLSTEAGYEEYRAGIADSVDWSGVLNTPDTLAGYGIEDAYTKTQTDTALAAKSDKSTTYTKMEVDEILLAPILGNFATAETSPASASHAVGEYLLYNNRLYKALAAISAGQQLTIGTNIGQTNVAAELASQANAISALNSKNLDNAGAHNAIYRGKYLGTSVTEAQWSAISSGAFTDLYIGDYWTINGVNWRIAAFDYWLNCGDTNCTTHHVVIVPDSNLHSAKMNDTNITTGAYLGSDFYTGNNNNTGRADAITKVNNAFGSSHILTHRELLTNATTNGYASGGTWVDATVELMSERMVYGNAVFENMISGTNIPYDYTIDKSQLPLFAHEPSRICNRGNWWLRSVASSAYFSFVYGTGLASYNYASNSCGVRPAFGIK